MDATLSAKIASMFILGGVSLFLGLLPIKLAKIFGWNSAEDIKGSKRSQMALSALNCFGAGVILTTALTHMLPEVNYFLKINIEHGSVSDTGLPLAEMFMLCGFFMIYIVEEVAHFFSHYMFNKYGDNPLAGGHEKTINTPSANHVHEDSIVVQSASENTFQSTLRGFLIVLALSLHAIFEGIALGLTAKASFVWYLTFAVAAHKYVIAFCVGVQFVVSGVKRLVILVYIATFALISPLGIAIGIALTSGASNGGPASEEDLQGPAVTVLQGLAAGTLIYVVFFEVLEKERARKSNGILQVTFCILGFVVMMVAQLLESSDMSVQPMAKEGACTLNPVLLASLSDSAVNVTCKNGELVVV